jgi:hypothetical protein
MILKDIKNCLNKAYGKDHGKSQAQRFNVLAKLLYAVIKSSQCSLQNLGSHTPDLIDLESRIKKAKRWLNSKYTDFETYYLPHLHLVFASLKAKEWVLIIDGSEVGNGATALMISLVWRNRAIPICWLVKKCKKGHLSVATHLEVVQKLADLLPPSDNRIVLLGDGEFDSPELQYFCKQQGWYYVFRTAKNTLISPDKNLNNSFAVGTLCPFENHHYWLVEQVYFTKKMYGPVNLMTWHDPKFENPIFLVSNLEWAKDLMDYYSKRFLIETLFRDIKSSGFNIDKVRIKDPNKLFNLLIIVAIAFLITLAFGAFEQ